MLKYVGVTADIKYRTKHQQKVHTKIITNQRGGAPVLLMLTTL